MKTIINKLFDVDYPEDCDNPNVGSIYDVYEKGFKSAMNFKKEGIDLTQLKADNIANTFLKPYEKEFIDCLEKLQADKEELLEALKSVIPAVSYFPLKLDEIETLIQKHKQ